MNDTAAIALSAAAMSAPFWSVILFYKLRDARQQLNTRNAERLHKHRTRNQ